MVTDSAVWLKAATTIAVRYLALRRQGDPLASGGREPQLIDFRTVQTRVMPLVATAYALNFTALFMQRVAPQAGLSDGDDEGEPMTDEEKMEVLPDLHATCAGLKAFSTWATYYGIDTLRQVSGQSDKVTEGQRDADDIHGFLTWIVFAPWFLCALCAVCAVCAVFTLTLRSLSSLSSQCLGGHGYSGYTSLGRMFTDFAVQCTWEGDNTVMALQTSRYMPKRERERAPPHLHCI